VTAPPRKGFRPSSPAPDDDPAGRGAVFPGPPSPRTVGRFTPDGRPDRVDAVDWRQGAACRGHDPELWFSALPADRDLATAVCASCSVRSRCLSTALGFEAVGGGSYGLWGGSSERDRRRALAPGRATTRRGPSRRGHTP
jgi:WhiB family redox-sensing transcriptional regulator